ncbi:MAG: hypothetical protein CL927_05860 [Deltaproteobacteria bacterium]|nr:hypothetical protein [Deltaproteobacteria bacterium]
MAHPHLVSLFAVCAGTFSLVGCTYEKSSDLEGYWEGVIACGDAGGVAIEYNVESTGTSNEYEAIGLITSLSIENEASDVEIDATWVQPRDSGSQVIKMESRCLVVQVNAEFETPCEAFDELGWDGADTLEATIANFLESGLDCDLTLVR